MSDQGHVAVAVEAAAENFENALGLLELANASLIDGEYILDDLVNDWVRRLVRFPLARFKRAAGEGAMSREQAGRNSERC